MSTRREEPPKLKNHAKEDDFNGRRRSTCKCWRTACSVDFSVQEASVCPLKAARRKILKPRGFVHWAHAGALRVNVIVVEAVFVVQEASACALKAAQRNAACVVETGVQISCVFTRFLSFLICSSRSGHPTEVFRSTRVCSSRTCAQANSSCLVNRVPARISSSVFVVARVLSCTPDRALAYFHIPTRFVLLHIANTISFVGGTCKS